VTKVSPISIREFLGEPKLDYLGLELLAGSTGLDIREISNPRIQKPGLALAGFLPYVKPGRLQILGESEYAFLRTLDAATVVERFSAVVRAGIPAMISTKGNRPPADVLVLCDELGVPCIGTSRQTSDVIEDASAFLEDALAERTQVHGVLVDVFSHGTLIVGEAGIGKSECALELIYRGHRLVADDVVVIRRTHNHGLRGEPHVLLSNFLELRGVGIIDVQKHFGMTASSPSVGVSLVIELVKLTAETRNREKLWQQRVRENPDAWSGHTEILGIEVPKFVMAVAPGRDFALMVETAVKKCLLAHRGVDDEGIFLDAIDRIAAGKEDER